jgi:hypothetical protein
VDKNIKAELLALRNEVMSNLKNIESVVEKIDVRLQDEETTSCLSRCPEISVLLDRCRQVRWHPDTEQGQILSFERSVEIVHNRLSVIQVDRYADSMAEMLRLASNLDRKMGAMPAKAAIEEYWDQVSPGTSDRAVEDLYERKVKEGDIKMPVEVDDRDIKDALDRLNKRMGQRDPLYLGDQKQEEPANLLDLAPSWAKDVDSKSTRQILAEAAEWDEDSQVLFGRMWNNTAERRIAVMEQVMSDAVAHVSSYNYYNERVTIKSHDDARALVSKYEALENAKKQVIAVLTGFDRATINDISVSASRMGDNVAEDLENWVRYYDWYARLVVELERIAAEVPQGMEVASSCLSFLRVMSAEKEREIFDPMVIDRNTFEMVPMNMPADKLESFRKKSYSDYSRDLRNAYAWRNQKNAIVA